MIMTEESSAQRVGYAIFFNFLQTPPDLPGGVVRLLNPGFFDKYVTGGPHGAGAALVTVFQQQYAVGA